MLRLRLTEDSLHNDVLLLLVRLVRVVLNETGLILALAVAEEESTQLSLLAFVIVRGDLVEPETHSLRVFLLSPRVFEILGSDLRKFFLHFVALSSLDESALLVVATVLVVASIVSIFVELGADTVTTAVCVASLVIVVVFATIVVSVRLLFLEVVV